MLQLKQADFLHEFTGFGSLIHNCFIACQKTMNVGEKNLTERRKYLLTRSRSLIKSCFHLGPTAPAISPSPTVKLTLPGPQAHTHCKTQGLHWGNGGKHVTYDPLVRVTARPAETSERRNVVKTIRSDSLLPPPDRKSGGLVLQTAIDCQTHIITCR